MTFRLDGLWRCVCVCVILLAFASPAEAAQQSGRPSERQARCVSFELPREHWGREVVRRLDALGVADIQLASGLVEACALAAVLRETADPATSPEMLALLEEWSALYEEEYTAPLAGENWEVAGWSAGGTVLSATGSVAPGRGEFPPERTGATPVAVGTDVLGSLGAAASIVPRVWAVGQAAVTPDEVRFDRLESAIELGPVALRVGRGPVALGYARGGAVVLSGVSHLDRIQVETAGPVVLPSFLSRLGGITFSTLLAKLTEPRHMDDPYFWVARGSVAPHPRFTLAVHRAAMFGGQGVPITGSNLLSLLIGDVTGISFENQVVSLEGVWRVPIEDVIPVTAYFEWGAEDAAGAWWDVPGRIFGLYFPSLPGSASSSLTIEYASFAESCCFNPEWYRHYSFPGSWVSQDEPIGHPLGGHGSELFLKFDTFLSDSTLRLGSDLFARSRGAENLYVPGREGRSFGGAVTADWRIRPKVEVGTVVRVEDGRGWSERSLRASGRVFF